MNKNIESKAPSNEGSYVHSFERPFTFEDRTFETLTFDFTRLTGYDDLAVENELQSLGKPVMMAETSGEYLIRMAARACAEKIGSDAFKAMPLRDERKIRNRMRAFLLRSGL